MCKSARPRRRWLVSLAVLWTSCFAASPHVFAATGSLRIRVVDDQTGQQMPARLLLRTSDGQYPGDRLSCSAERWPHIDAHGIFISGAETFEVPSGETSVTAAHGLEYRAATNAVDVPPGETITVEMRLKRVVDMKRAGWVSGDLHVHMVHGENQRQTSYDDVALTCAASGLDFVSVGQEYVGAGTLDLEGYHAECRRVSTEQLRVFLGAERPKNLLGHQVMLGVRNPFAITEDPPYFDAARAVHAEGGVLVYVHPVRYYPGKHWQNEWLDFPGNNLARELVVDAFAGPSFDGLSVLSDEPTHPDAHQLWFNLLNRGCFVPVFADSDACFDRPTFGLKAPGFWSTYFHIGAGAAVTPENLAEAVRNGQTFATTGPLVQFDIDGQLSGATIPLDGHARTMTVEVHYPQHAFSLNAVDPKTDQPVVVTRVELVRNGQIVHQWKPESGHARITHTINESQPSWYVVRAYGTDDRWQVAVTSPIYFASEPIPRKREPLDVVIHGRIYDFETGRERSARVEIRRGDDLIDQVEAEGEFQLKMPIDAEIIVTAPGDRPLRKNLLMDYGPVHRFLWNLEASDLGRAETLERFEYLVREVEMEFPVGYRMPGCYFAQELPHAAPLEVVKIASGPPRASDGTVAVAAILLDAERIAPGDSFNAAAVFRDEGNAAETDTYLIEVRGYDPRRPTGFGPLKRFATLEVTANAAVELGDGYKMLAGTITVPSWVTAGPTGAIDISVRVVQENQDVASVGLAIPLGSTKYALSHSSNWPTMPLSWPDRNYGIGPLKICNRLGRKAACKSDYRDLRLSVRVAGEQLDLLPSRDARGTADADDAIYTDHFLDQILNEESHLVEPAIIRQQN